MVKSSYTSYYGSYLTESKHILRKVCLENQKEAHDPNGDKKRDYKCFLLTQN